MQSVRYRPFPFALFAMAFGVFSLLLAVVKPVQAAPDVNLITLLSGHPTSEGGQESAKEGLTTEEYEMLCLINRDRITAGLPKLEADPQLTGLARQKSRDMVRARYFGHRSQQLGSVYQQLEHHQIAYRAVAENLVGAPGGRRAHQSIMQSPAHRTNVLNPGFTRIGIGIVKGGPYGKMITQILID